MTTYNFRATVASPPRIGPNRELKHALESYWAGDTSGPTPWAVARELNAAYAKQLRAAGLDSVPWLGISLYDQMLDMTAALGVLPARFTTPDTYASVEQLLAACFATARGTAEHPAAAMTKWFDTNYHYIVPELESEVSFSAHPELLLDGIAGPEFRPVLIGPYTFLRLARRVAEGQAPRPLTPAELSELLPSLTQAYIELIGALAATGVRWIQLDEPALMLDVPTEHNDAIIAAYETLAGATQVRLLVATYFGDGNNAVELLQRTPVAGIAVDLVTSAADPVPAWGGTKLLVAGVIDGRNVWRTDLRRAKEQLQALQQRAYSTAIGVSSLEIQNGVSVFLSRNSVAVVIPKMSFSVCISRIRLHQDMGRGQINAFYQRRCISFVNSHSTFFKSGDSFGIYLGENAFNFRINVGGICRTYILYRQVKRSFTDSCIV